MLHKSEVKVGDTMTYINDGISFVVGRINDRYFYDEKDSLKAAFSNDSSEFWRITARAPSSPAPTPTEGERWVPGAVWWSPAYGLRFVVKEQHEVEPLFFSFWPNGESGGQRRREKDSEALMNRTYAGNLSAVFAGLVRLHGPLNKIASSCCRCGKRAVLTGGLCAPCDEILEREVSGKPAPAFDAGIGGTAEELAARQREKHRAEAERLQERYLAFRATVTRVVAEFPAVRATTDTYRSKVPGTLPRFVAWLSCDGLRQEFTVAESDPAHATESRARDIVSCFRAELGSRLLKGGGK